ncbi:MAG: hypothetical protein AAFY15_04580 [Cyanobacteria bacterium J06648_11]
MTYKRYAKPREIALVLTYLSTPRPRTARSIANELRQNSQWVKRRLQDARSQELVESEKPRTGLPALWSLTAKGEAWLDEWRAVG